MFRKKKTKGFEVKPRTSQEIDRDYSQNAIQIGHKARLISQLQEEMEQHIKKLTDLTLEAAKLPPPEMKVTPKEETKETA